MLITNNNIPLIDLPNWELMQPFPAASAAGVCFVNDKRGTNDYIYALFGVTSFWRYSCKANTWQQLASPNALGGSGTWGAGTCMVFDPSQGTAGRIWLLNGYTTQCGFGYYDIATNTWTSRSITNLTAIFGTDGAMAHTCSTYNVAGNDDFIYLIGNNVVTFYRYSISGNSWVASPTTVANCPSTSASGCSLVWVPGWNTDRIVRVRGGATATIDYYSITGNNWTPITYNPAIETFTTGTMIASDITTDQVYITKDNSLRIFLLDLGDATMAPVATMYLMASSTAIAGDRFLFVKETNGIRFLYLGLHTSSYWARTPLLF